MNDRNITDFENFNFIPHPDESNCLIGNCTYSTLHDFIPLHNSNISILHLNCRSLKKNLPSLITLLATLNTRPTIIALTETWLKEGEEIFLSIPNYTLVSSPRTSGRGGGVGFYIDQKHQFVEITCHKAKDDAFEALTIEITCPVTRNLVISCMYRPPGTDPKCFNNELDIFLVSLSKCINKKIYCLVGDFNLNLLNLDAHCPTSDYFNLLTSNCLLPTITKPTRITERTATLIDNIFINALCYTMKSTILYDDLSDHFPILLEVEITGSRKVNYDNTDNMETRRFYTNKAINTFTNLLAVHDWSDLILRCQIENNSDVLYNKFLETISNIYNTAFPVRVIKISKKQKTSPPWMTKSLIKSCKTKSKLLAASKKVGTEDSKNKFTAYRNKLKKIIKAAERLYYDQKFLIHSADARKTWHYINEILGKDKSQKKLFSFEGPSGKRLSDMEIATMFNDYFVNIGPNLAHNISCSNTNFKDFLPPSPSNSAYFAPCDNSEVHNLILGLKSSMCTGYDGISGHVFKNVSKEIAIPLSYLINNSLSNGIFPSALKEAKIIPIFKAGDKNLCSNYRPISILPFFSKIYEKIIYKRLKSYLSQINIPSKNQFGFQEKCSTYSAISNAYEQLTEAVDKKLHTIGVFIDLCKAFDTVDHNILLSKLCAYGRGGSRLFV